MKKVKKVEQTKEEVKNKVKSFSKYRSARMVRIEGGFMGGGFNTSQNKVKAILENQDILKKFVAGEFDKDIDELQDDEVLEV